ncbi:unnamed protein product [Toxocara canis]|uniref:Uncharacterized protein n=1 Tax=Toxocara canis TaxID=6265 RepID=A0A3P7ITW1_TOXCA|nr:unnamed protein product [Toxocara canis]
MVVFDIRRRAVPKMIRLYYRYLLVAAIVLFGLYTAFQSLPLEYAAVQREGVTITCPTLERIGSSKEERSVSSAKRIVCTVDGLKNYNCLRDSEDIYLPFDKFLKKQFDVSGKLLKGKGAEPDRFEWLTSYSKVRFPDEGDYDPTGPFGHFASYSVESRDRVRCISAQYGVPMSTQWSPNPYFYPIQIAQYALQHYSRNKTGEEPVVLELGRKATEWIFNATGNKGNGFRQSYDKTFDSNIVEIISQGGLNFWFISIILEVRESGSSAELKRWERAEERWGGGGGGGGGEMGPETQQQLFENKCNEEYFHVNFEVFLQIIFL